MAADDNKIYKYKKSELAVWRALVTVSHTIITNKETWYLLFLCIVITIITIGIVFATGSEGSVSEDDVTGKVIVLLSFVLAGFVTFCLNRWDRLRNTHLGSVLAALESTYYLSCQMYPDIKDAQHLANREIVLRLCRCIFQSIFFAVNETGDLSSLVEMGLLAPYEEYILSSTHQETRPYVLIGWLEKMLAPAEKQQAKDFYPSEVHKELAVVKKEISTIIGLVGCSAPFMYTHLIWWFCQLLSIGGSTSSIFSLHILLSFYCDSLLWVPRLPIPT